MTYASTHGLGTSRDLPAFPGHEFTTRAAASDALAEQGSVLYAVRMRSGLIKIGWTGALDNRLRSLGVRAVLAFTFGSRDDETEVHRSLRPHVAYGREYYHPHPEVLAVVNEWRTQWGRSPIAA